MERIVCPGKEYYDLYPGYYEEEELPRPRAAVLKNTNIEAELLSQRRQGEATGRRVHYSVQDQEDIEYAAYHRWGPATLVNLSYQPDVVSFIIVYYRGLGKIQSKIPSPVTPSSTVGTSPPARAPGRGTTTLGTGTTGAGGPSGEVVFVLCLMAPTIYEQ